MSTTPDRDLVAAVHIDAPPDVVFPYLVDAELMTRWLASSAVLDPRPGGECTIRVGDVSTEGTYLEVDPPNRVVFTWGVRGRPSLPPGSTSVEIRLQPADDGTLVTLTHRGLAEEDHDAHLEGWQRCLAGLADAARSTD